MLKKGKKVKSMKPYSSVKFICTFVLISSSIVISLALLPGCIRAKKSIPVPIVDESSQVEINAPFSFCHAERRLPEVRLTEGWLACATIRKAGKARENDDIFIEMDRDVKGFVNTKITVKRKTVRYPLYYPVLKSKGRDKTPTISLADALVKAVLSH